MAKQVVKVCTVCGNDFKDRTKDHRLAKCEQCRVKRNCRKCKKEFISVESRAYCDECEPLMKGQMESSDYLTRVPKKTPQRPEEAREKTYETKHGTWHG